ncbi:hypothetical protein SH580_19655 [Coraliomargarita algicola]|uniref:Uncharacterized protein n=1 Tax=Coraliomargarita algicola TaxID=3092156 RepID=A0ABZ0RKM3_9BACT|nr:hypothetical protein [Coraliomargarita sp. J2-16]WPJ95638.1 hypothetical protein SH580_19655 [Coraliomargarita sp. J2-16]
MRESDAFLVAAMAYCLSWEITGARASQHWSGIRDYIKQNSTLTETERWCCELYEESSPTAQEERSIQSRINARIDHPRMVIKLRQSILDILPATIVESARKHRLIQSLIAPEGYGPLRTWLAERNIAGFRPVPPTLAPLAAREAEFYHFLESPCFLEGYRKYWHQEPKLRNNKQMRVLLSVSAALSQMLTVDSAEELQHWCARLAVIGSYTEQTQLDVVELCSMMSAESYDAHELGYRLLVDAQALDRQNIVTFCERYADELTGFARELVRGMQITA